MRTIVSSYWRHCYCWPLRKKQLAKCPQVARAPQAFLDYRYFLVGSRWVYRLHGSSPAVYVTMRVTGTHESHLTEYEDGDGRVPCGQSYSVGVTHSNHTYFPGVGRLSGEALLSAPFHGEDWVLSYSSSAGTLYSHRWRLATPSA